MNRTNPPFRADHVGSLLRPPALKEARAQRQRGEIGADELKTIEDREIENAIRKQEEVGLQSITDGEFRRSWWHLDFLWGLDGAEKHVMDTGIAFATVTTRNEGVAVTGPLGLAVPHPMVEQRRVGNAKRAHAFSYKHFIIKFAWALRLRAFAHPTFATI
jgi:5-methyltetrahydropteroyltriglutamate--homocysteine methyltransferase